MFEMGTSRIGIWYGESKTSTFISTHCVRTVLFSFNKGIHLLNTVAYLGYGRQGTCHGRHWQGAFGSFGYQHFRIDVFLLILTYVYISVY
jgi:hypothetical protein